MSQLSLFDSPRPAEPRRSDPDFVRKVLVSTLRQLRRAQRFPWREHEVRKWERQFPALAARLPDGEGQPMVEEFRREIARLAQEAEERALREQAPGA
jgi:hypothetical protein